MTSPPPTPPAAPTPTTFNAGGLVNGAVVLGLIYFGREVLVPIMLAMLLSLLIAPLVRKLRRLVRSQVAAVLGAVLVLTLMVGGLASVIVTQVVSMAAGLPQYEDTIRDKLHTVQDVTLGRMMQGETGRMMSRLGAEANAASAPAGGAMTSPPLTASGAVPVEIRPRPQTPVEVVSHLASSIWGPLGHASIVLIVMVFVLLEHEALRDRFIRLLGGSDIRRTTQAFNDAGERLSRFFVSQLGVNVGVGIAVGLGLMVMGLPHALLWAVLTTLLRFVPYVGVFIAAGSAALMAAAVDPGWTLLFEVLGMFAAVEVIAAQVVEPQLYGHSTGLSPLSVVVAAIFWSWIWGPIGLLVSTPLTLCLVVAGRHLKSLAFIDVLLGDTPALSMSERFYQRAMVGDHEEIVAAARNYLKRKSFARYCDKILIPALQLASADLGKHTITPEQQVRVKSTVARVVESLGADDCRPSWRNQRGSVLDDTSIGAHLRQQRERAMGKWQGPVAVAPGSVVLAIGLGSMRDDLMTELLVRILRTQDIDARHISLDDFGDGPPPGASPDGIAMVFVVSANPSEEWDRIAEHLPALRERFTTAVFAALLSNGEFAPADDAMDLVVRSFEQASAEATARYAKAA